MTLYLRRANFPNPDSPYKSGDVHTTLRCPECGGAITFEPNLGTHLRAYWPCRHWPACRGYRLTLDDTYEPDPVLRITRDQRALLKQELLIFERDELASFDDGLAIVHGVMGERRTLTQMRREEYPAALAALAEHRRALLAARRPAPRVMPPTHRPRASGCCEVTRDAYGALTVCYEARRWCLGVADHAARPGHTEALRGETWGEADDEETLREDAQEAFMRADSRRRGNLRARA